jgi:hypothetical protein
MFLFQIKLIKQNLVKLCDLIVDDRDQIFLVPGRTKRAAKSEATMKSSKKSKTEILEIQRPILSVRGRSMFTDEKVTKSGNGDLKINGVFKINYDDETMTVIKKLKIDTGKINAIHNGYIYFGNDSLHCIFGALKKEKDFATLISQGFTGTIEDLDCVAHLVNYFD